MPATPIRYRSPEEDSARWLDFRARPGDVVISTRSKHGTTWMQMLVALLVFGTPELPAPLAELSPWLDWLVLDQDEVFYRLEAQEHRRFVKTHTPLDGIPLDPDVIYVVVARHPLDAAVSLYHQGANLDRDRLRQLTGSGEQERAPRPPVGEWLASWVRREADPRIELDSLPGVLHHLSDAWGRRRADNVILVHYDELSTDLERQLRRLAERLDVEVPEPVWPSLIAAARFGAMRARARELAPDPRGVFRDVTAFFREGRSGAGPALLETEDLHEYYARTRRMAPSDLLDWLHRCTSG